MFVDTDIQQLFLGCLWVFFEWLLPSNGDDREREKKNGEERTTNIKGARIDVDKCFFKESCRECFSFDLLLFET